MTEYEVYDIFLNFEEQNNLFKYTYKDINIWDYARYHYYKVLNCTLLNMTNMIKTPVMPKNFETNDYIKEHCLNFDKLKPCDIILMGDTRRVKQSDGFFHDIYMDNIPDILTDYSYLCIEDPFWNFFPHKTVSHYIPAYTNNIMYTDNEILRFYNMLFDEHSMSEEKEYLTSILEVITRIFEEHFKIDFSSSKSNSLSFILFSLFTEDYYKKILKITNPKIIFILFHPNPSTWSLLRCAKLLNIPVIEIQHGIIGEFEPIWHKFKNTRKQHLLPDYIFSLSKRFFYENDMLLTEGKNKVKFVGYPFLENKIKQYDITKKDTIKNKIYSFCITN